MRENDSFSEALNGVHRELHSMWSGFRSGLEAGAMEDCRVRFEPFAQALRRHIRDEEDILFPPFEEHTGMKNAGPTMVMRSEHRQLEALLNELSAGLERGGDPGLLRERSNQFSALIDSHDRKEEGILYPMMERTFGAAEASALLAKTNAARGKVQD